MRSATTATILAAALMVTLAECSLVGCGVEAGNPKGEKPTKPGTSALTIGFAGIKDIFDGSLTLNLKSISLIGTNGETAVAPLAKSFDLSRTSSDQAVTVARATGLSADTYYRIAFTLDDAAPLTYLAADGSSRSVRPQQGKKAVVYQDETIALADGEGVSVVVALDPRLSLTQDAGNNNDYTFKPATSVSRPGEGGDLGGTASDGAVWVCAYLYAPVDPPRPPPAGPSGNHPPPPSDGMEAAPRPAFPTRAEVVKDTVASCTHAFSRVSVTNGHFQFHSLIPAFYDLRQFRADGSYVDTPTEVAVGPAPLPRPGPPPTRKNTPPPPG